MTHIACGYFFGSGIQNDVVSKDVGFLRSDGFHLCINYLVPFKRSQTHPPAQRVFGGVDLADELPRCAPDLAFLKHASTFPDEYGIPDSITV